MRFRVRIAKVEEFESASILSKKSKNISTYKEINKLFIGKSFTSISKRTDLRPVKRVRLTIPFLGKVK